MIQTPPAAMRPNTRSVPKPTVADQERSTSCAVDMAKGMLERERLNRLPLRGVYEDRCFSKEFAARVFGETFRRPVVTRRSGSRNARGGGMTDLRGGGERLTDMPPPGAPVSAVARPSDRATAICR